MRAPRPTTHSRPSAILLGLAACLVAFTIIASTDASPTQPETPTFEDRLRALDEKSAAVEGLHATFIQRKHTPMLRRPMESSGTVVVKGARSRWDTKEPSASVMTIDEKLLRIYYPEQRVIETFPISESTGGVSGSPLPRIESMRAHFDVSEGELAPGERERPELLAITLTPLTDSFKEHVSKVTIVVDTMVPCVNRAVIEMPDGDRTELVFEKVTLASGIDDSEVLFEPPAGTRVEWPLGQPSPAHGPQSPGR